MSDMSIIELENGENLYISNFEDVLKRTKVINYNKDLIEIPGIIMFINDKSATLWVKLLNPGIELITIDEETFAEMLEAIEAHKIEKDIIVFKTKTIPAKDVILNIPVILKETIFIRIFQNSIIINDMIFTSSESEFHGDGMFTSRKAYFLTMDQMFNLRKNFED